MLILDEPTRGIDVGAKYEIYTIINELADEGKGVIVISSEMPELLGMCDRIYVMNEGRFVGEMPAAEASQEKIMRAIMKARGWDHANEMTRRRRSRAHRRVLAPTGARAAASWKQQPARVRHAAARCSRSWCSSSS